MSETKLRDEVREIAAETWTQYRELLTDPFLYFMLAVVAGVFATAVGGTWLTLRYDLDRKVEPYTRWLGPNLQPHLERVVDCRGWWQPVCNLSGPLRYDDNGGFPQ